MDEEKKNAQSKIIIQSEAPVKSKQGAEKKIIAESIIEKITKLLKLRNISKVYYIDDANCKSFDVEFFLIKLKIVLEKGQTKELEGLKLEDITLDAPEEIVNEEIRSYWAKIDNPRKVELFKGITKIWDDASLEFDFEVASKLLEYFEADKIENIDPNDWETIQDSLVKELTDNSGNILLIFDQDLKYAGGKFEKFKGEDFIIQIKNSALHSKSICALLTHEITSADHELLYREKIIEAKEELNTNDFFPLAKKRLEESNVFADGIKKTIINENFEVIKSETLKLIKDSYDKAIDKIKKIDTYDFDFTILQTSLREGVWEPETILRIADIIYRDEIRNCMIQDHYPQKVNKEIKAATKLSAINFDIPENYKPYSEKFKMRHKELYINGEIINSLNKPTENGDIFDIRGEQYILVAQPCDMMIRGKGDKVGKRNSKYVTLLRITNMEFADYSKKVKRPDSFSHFLSSKFGLTYFIEGDTKVGVIDFNDSLTVNIDYLDLVVFNKEGNCVLDINDLITDFSDYSLPWEKRYGFIISNLKEAVEKLIEYKAVLKDEYRTTLPFQENIIPNLVIASSNDLQNQIFLNDDKFDFSVRRIMNFKNPGAAYLLERYSRHLSRTAELHDFAL